VSNLRKAAEQALDVGETTIRLLRAESKYPVLVLIAELDKLCDALRAALAEPDEVAAAVKAERKIWIDFLHRNGFRRCDIAACNCGSWHHVEGWPKRFREIDEATRDDWRNSETLLTRVERICAERDGLKAALIAIRDSTFRSAIILRGIADDAIRARSKP
jgi:hypothetical protein